MALFQKEHANENSVNYKSMSKDQLISLIKSQKNKIDELNRKLSEASAATSEKNDLEQKVTSLTEENKSLNAKAAELEKKLSDIMDKESEITEIGSIAEMAFRVNGVMDAAQKAADDYLAKIKEMYIAMSQDYSVYEKNAKKKADSILNNANTEADAIKQNARDEANNIWATLQSQFNSFVEDKKSNE